MCIFSVRDENVHTPGLIWLNSECHICLRLFLKKIDNNCLRGLLLFLDTFINHEENV